MFLKRIEIQGFKSFADKVVISFENSVTGIVGPNGCGKSNITDAIRWVLGEQSVKSLRGSSMSDVIFAGSADRKPVNMAEVTLVFNNENKALNSDLPEIEITRRLYRNSGEGEYLINRVTCRLKDIVDLILDSGLGRDSLSMISQGNISSFAEAKPIERRALFEEAAGVAKYKKRKIESMSKLERTKENLDRTQDIVGELERQVSPLKRQAKKAEIFRTKKARLQEIEIAVLVEDIENLSVQIEEDNKELFAIEADSAMHETTIQVHETANNEAKKEMMELDREVNYLQEEMMKTIHEIQTLETRKIEIDEKRKYALEVGNNEEKIKQLKTLLDEANFEYLDRSKRLQSNQVELELLSKKLQSTAILLAENNQKYEETAMILRRMENRKEILENILRQPFNQQAGVRAIVENQSSLSGVLGVVSQHLKPHSGYEEAISVALGGALFNIVTTDEASARNAITFLKKNQSGRATFLPARVLNARNVNRDHLVICENTLGFAGVANTFVDCEAAFGIINDSLLGNVIVMDNLENGNILAELLHFNYKIVTLDGDVIHRGGSMSGGKAKDSTSPLTVQKEYDAIHQNIESQHASLQLAIQALNDSKRLRTEIESQLMEKRISLAQLEPVVDAKRAKYERLKNDYELIAPKLEGEMSELSFADDLIIHLNEAYSKRDEATTTIRLKRERRMKTASEVERKEQQIRQIRRELSTLQMKERSIQIEKTRVETKLENSLSRLASEYQLTFEFAKTKVSDAHIENAAQEVLTLRNEIEALGNVNMNAPEEFDEVNERYEFLKKQLDDLILARDKILAAIDDMDVVMGTQFKEMFDKINGELNEVFRSLFGGGKARLILEDPSDILNTGIDVDVQPPGKAIQNIRLFSGGEKSLIAICVLFSILKARPVPLCIFDEVEAALDQGNVERFARYLKQFSEKTQFLVVTHRPGTMSQCDILYGVTMQKQGVSQMLKVHLTDAIEMAEAPVINEGVEA